MMNDAKLKIKNALISQKEEISSECFCKIAIKGGYENFVRDMIFSKLRELEDDKNKLKAEVTFPIPELSGQANQQATIRIDLVYGGCKHPEYIIELGHNGTWQNPYSSLRHAKNDINRSFKLFTNVNRYTVSVITNILEINESETHRIRRSYLPYVERNIYNNPENLDIIRYLFTEIDKNHLAIKCTTSWNGFEADIHFFICGPFNEPVVLPDRKSLPGITIMREILRQRESTGRGTITM